MNRLVPEYYEKAYSRARRDAHMETGMPIAIDGDDDVATAIEQTRGMFSELAVPLKDVTHAPSHHACALQRE